MKQYYYIREGIIIAFGWKLDERYSLGESYEDSMRVYVPLNADQVDFHKKYPNASALEVWNKKLEVIEVDTIEETRQKKLQELYEYNNGDEVNSFTFMGRKMWVSLQERIAFRQAVEAKLALGIESITLPIDGLMSTPLPCATVKTMLDRLEVYASDADTRIKYHESVIRELKNEEEINNYNYKEGMPDLLNFDNL